MKFKILFLIELFLLVFAFFISIEVASAAYWVNNPANCPVTDDSAFPGQSCSPIKICGNSGGVAQCYDTSSLSPPGGAITSVTQYSGSFGGGYIVDCEATADSSSPFCDNSGAFWCNRDSSCYIVNRLTVCTASVWATFTCDACRSGYLNCTGPYTNPPGCEVQIGVTSCSAGSNNNINSTCGCECDSGAHDCDGNGAGAGNGCEIVDGTACSVGGVPGVYSGCNGAAGNCALTPQNFTTGIEAKYLTSNPLLWGLQYGSGLLMNLTNASGSSFGINAAGCIIFPDGSLQCNASTGGNYVPYIGANNNVDLGDKNLTTIGVVSGGDLSKFGNATYYWQFDSVSNTYPLLVAYDGLGGNVGGIKDGLLLYSGSGVHPFIQFYRDDLAGYGEIRYYQSGALENQMWFSGAINYVFDENLTVINTAKIAKLMINSLNEPTHELNVVGDANITGTLYIDGDKNVSNELLKMYNSTYESTYNASYESTYNETYDTWAYNMTTPAMAYADTQITANMSVGVLQGILNDTGIYSTYNESYYEEEDDVKFNSVNVTTVLRVGSTLMHASDDGLNITGSSHFNSGWQAGGVSIIDGDIFAQRLFVYNITSLAVTHLNINGSLLPQFDNEFDIGSASNRYKDLYLSGDANVSNDIYLGDDLFVTGSVGIGTDALSRKLNVVSNSAGQILANGTSGANLGGIVSYNDFGYWLISGVRGSASDSGNASILYTNSPKGIYFVGDTTYASPDMAITSTGKVGIQTPAPTHELNVVGDANITGTLYIDGDKNVSGELAGLVPYTGAIDNVDLGDKNLTTIGVVSGGFESKFGDAQRYLKFEQLDLGAVGSYVMGSFYSDGVLGNLGGFADEIIIYDKAGDNTMLLSFSDQSLNLGHLFFNTTETYPFRFDRGLNINQTLYINEINNRVGIGTSSPTHELNVVGDANITGNLNTGAGSSASGVDAVALGTGTNASGQNAIAIGKLSNASTDSAIAIGIGNVVSRPGGMVFGYGSTANGTVSMTLGSESFSGGTISTALGYRIRTTGDYAIGIGNNFNCTQNNAVCIGGGNVGIGTGAPSQLLDVVRADAGGTPVARFESNHVNGAAIILNASATGGGQYLFVSTANGASMGGGKFAILNSGSGTYVFVANSSGSVGIGTSFPTHKLNVVGDENITGNLIVGGNLFSGTSSATGIGAVAFGENTIASGAYSLAAGLNSIASQNYSVAMGYNTTASGFESVAMGLRTTATRAGSVAMGIDSFSTGFASAAIGQFANASGQTAIALGTNTTASGNFSFASGYRTVASGIASTAFGGNTTATETGSVAMGFNTVSSGNGSFAGGFNTLASSQGGFAQGYYSRALGDFASVAMGFNTTAADDYAVAMGFETLADGVASVAMGYQNNATGDKSFAVGSGNLAQGDNSAAFGSGAIVTTDDTLGIGGRLQLFPSQQLTCDATTEGMIYYNSTTKHHYGCNSTNWYALY